MALEFATSHFDSKTSAYRYYKVYGYTRDQVDVKFDEKEIAIGYPPLQSGDTVKLNHEGRYVIVTHD